MQIRAKARRELLHFGKLPESDADTITQDKNTLYYSRKMIRRGVRCQMDFIPFGF